MNTRGLWIQRFLAVGHFGFGLALLVGAVGGIAWFTAALSGLRPSGTAGYWLLLLNPGFSLLGPLFMLPQAALGLWMLLLARRLWAGHGRRMLALLVTDGFVLLLGLLLISVGFDAVAAAERSSARGGGLLSPIAGLPILHGVPLTIFGLASIVLALAAAGIERRRLL